MIQRTENTEIEPIEENYVSLGEFGGPIRDASGFPMDLNLSVIHTVKVDTLRNGRTNPLLTLPLQKSIAF
ncbi:MAG: hypothetical protein JNL74_09955 [Fibrobacteres bacterium]|nr:hypothetical protein [Fibrobacterota bacterium]